MCTRVRGSQRRRIVTALASVAASIAMLVALPGGAFADDATPATTTTPASTPATPTTVTVHGSGFTPNAVLGLAECIAGVEPNGHTCDSTSTPAASDLAATGDVEVTGGGLFDQFAADASGEFTRTITIRSRFDSTDGTDGTVDCLTEPDGCVLLAANRGDYGAERATLPIVFAAGIDTRRGAGVRTLAFTGAGSSTGPLALAGGIALALGLALLVAVRRRRRATSPIVTS